MNPTHVFRILAATVFAGAILVAATSRAHQPAEEMVRWTRAIMASLDGEQREQALYEFNGERRDFWHFVPDKFIKPDGKRYGLTVGEMTPRQRLLTRSLLNSGLSQKGYRQSVVIMTLETILHDLENNNPLRDPNLYYLSIFGEPVAKQTWAWRFEGHHLSLNFTLVGGHLISVTPSFFGSNPARVKDGPLAGLEVSAAEQNLARNLVQSLSPEQRKLAMIADQAPRDIITSQDRRVDEGTFLPPRGISFDQLKSEQQDLLLKLVNEYASKYRPPILKQIDARTPIADGKHMHFAWAGGFKRGQGHYYRIQTPAYLFEYDNTQNDANHVHAVWRHFDGDFGEDLLRKHLEESPHHNGGAREKIEGE